MAVKRCLRFGGHTEKSEISFGSLSLYNDGRAYKLHVSLNISHSDRCLNRLSVSYSMPVHTRNETSFCFSDVFSSTTRTSNSIDNVISLPMRNFIFYITVKRQFLCVTNKDTIKDIFIVS